jgi:hypothetical protein
MALRLKPESELVIGVTAVSIVLSVFSNTAPNLADVRADKPGNTNTHKSVKMAAITSAAYVGSLSLLAKSPTIFIIGGAAILFETWKLHYANHGASGHEENAVNQAAAPVYMP